MAQFSRPISDISVAAWNATPGGADRYVEVDEAVRDDTDFVSTTSSNNALVLGLQDIDEAQSGTWTVAGAGKTDNFASAPNGTVTFKQDGVTIRSQTITQTAAYQGFTFDLTGPEVASLVVTNGKYQNLTIEVLGPLNKGELLYFSQVYVQAPDALPKVSSRLPLLGVS